MVNSGGHQTSITSKQGENFQNFYLIKYSSTRDKPVGKLQIKPKIIRAHRLLADFSWAGDQRTELTVKYFTFKIF